MDEKQPLMSDDKKTTTRPSDPPPPYITATREQHGLPLRPLPPGPPQPLELPIIQYMKTHRVILASASPRRRAMFAQLGLSNIEIRPSTKPEDLSKTELGPFGYVAGTARQKALDVYQATIAELEEAEESKNRAAAAAAEEGDSDDEEDIHDESTPEPDDDETTKNKKSKDKNKNKKNRNRKSQVKKPHPGGDPDLVIAADTVVVTRDGQVLEKPGSAAAHGRMLRHLRDTRAHKVLTAVCAVAPRADAQHPGYEMRTHVEETRVLFVRESEGLPDDVIESYVRSREGADKAGGYAIQGVGGMLLVEKVDGAVDNVVGLPVRKMLALCEKVVFRQGGAGDESEPESDDGDGDW